jgi:hypothetical protein
VCGCRKSFPIQQSSDASCSCPSNRQRSQQVQGTYSLLLIVCCLLRACQARNVVNVQVAPLDLGPKYTELGGSEDGRAGLALLRSMLEFESAQRPSPVRIINIDAAFATLLAMPRGTTGARRPTTLMYVLL